MTITAAGPRRLGPDRARPVGPDLLAQPVDIDVNLRPGQSREARNLPGYPTLAVDLAARSITAAADLDVFHAVIRLSDGCDAVDAGSCFERARRLAEQFAVLRESIHPGVRTTVDPFAVALGADGVWGVAADGEIDYPRTVDLIEYSADQLARAGADQLVTLGRVDAEVAACRRGIEAAGAATRIASFSPNTETSTAYVYLEHGHDTGQKIHPGNTDQMLLWALLDIWSGTNTVLVKPMENLHVMARLAEFLSQPKLALEYLNGATARAAALGSRWAAATLESLLASPAEFMTYMSAATLGAYAVSGSTYMLRLVAEDRGPGQALNRLHEMWIEAAAAMGSHASILIDRNAVTAQRGTVLH